MYLAVIGGIYRFAEGQIFGYSEVDEGYSRLVMLIF